MKAWKRVDTYIQGQSAIVYDNDTGFILGKVNGQWVMENFDGDIVETAKTLKELKAKYQQWYTD